MRLSRILIGLLAVIVLIILIVWIFGGKKKPTVTPPPPPPPLSLPDYSSTDAVVSLTNDGIVNGDELHRAIRISISADSRELDVIQGYSNNVIQKQTFYNTQDAFDVFLRAINGFGFLSKLSKPTAPTSPIGQCPLGSRYIFDLDQGGGDLSSTWASTCGKSVGTSSADALNMLTLFRDQIPDYSKLTSNVNLSATAPQTSQ